MTKLRVMFPNGSDIVVGPSVLKTYFDADSQIHVSKVEEDFNMTPKEIRRHNNRFSALVGAIDAKWGYTYEKLEQDDQPKHTPEMREYLERLLEVEGY